MNLDPISQIQAELDRINEARAKATQGEWYVDLKDAPNGPCGIESELDAHSWICEPSEMDARPRQNDSKFIALAANEITNLTKALSVAVSAFESHRCGNYCNLDSDSVLKSIAEILTRASESGGGEKK